MTRKQKMGMFISEFTTALADCFYEPEERGLQIFPCLLDEANEEDAEDLILAMFFSMQRIANVILEDDIDSLELINIINRLMFVEVLNDTNDIEIPDSKLSAEEFMNHIYNNNISEADDEDDDDNDFDIADDN
jgi:hypothetical protein